MGLNEASDGFNAASDVIIMDQTRVEKSTDDVLGMPRTFSEAYQQLSEVLTKCIENGFIVSRKKFNIGRSIKYGVFEITKAANKHITIKADQKRIQAILDIDIPKNKTEVQ